MTITTLTFPNVKYSDVCRLRVLYESIHYDGNARFHVSKYGRDICSENSSWLIECLQRKLPIINNNWLHSDSTNASNVEILTFRTVRKIKLRKIMFEIILHAGDPLNAFDLILTIRYGSATYIKRSSPTFTVHRKKTSITKRNE